MERPYPLVPPRSRRCELYGYGLAQQYVRFALKSTLERSDRNEKQSAEVECSVRPYLLPELSNFYCHPGRAGGSPWVISVAHHPYSCAARVEARPRRVGGRTARFWKDCRGSLQRRLRMR